MNLSASQEIDAPAARIFDTVTDMPRITRAIASAGGSLTPVDADAGTWQLRGTFYGVSLDAPVTVSTVQDTGTLAASLHASGLTAQVDGTVQPIDPARGRLDLTITLGAKGLRGQVLLRSLGLAQGRIEKGLTDGLERLGKRIAREYRQAQKTG